MLITIRAISAGARNWNIWVAITSNHLKMLGNHVVTRHSVTRHIVLRLDIPLMPWARTEYLYHRLYILWVHVCAIYMMTKKTMRIDQRPHE